MSLRRALHDWAIPFGLALMVIAFAAGSSSEPWAKSRGLDARWVVLALLCAAALLDAGLRFRRTRRLPSIGLMRFGALAGAFLVVSVVSTAWSVTPRLTFERAGSLGILFLLCAALALSSEGDRRSRVRLFEGLAAGAVAVGILGIGVLLLDYDAAVQRGTGAWRYRGFTENPNTIAILAGAALPVLVGLAVIARTRRRQIAWLAGAVLMLASALAAESRGGLLAACTGTVVVAAFGVEGRGRRLAAVTALLAAFAGGIVLREAAGPPPPAFSSHVAAPTAPPPVSTPATNGTASTSTPGKASSKSRPGKTGAGPSSRKHGKGQTGSGGHRAKPVPKGPPPIVRLQTKTKELPGEQDEIGHPALSKEATTTLASGRLAAWKGALDLIADRPLLGYGFGTEQKVFVDRWYFFQGGTPENSYLGLLLQLGIVGLVSIAAIGCALAVGGVRAVRSLSGDERTLVVIELGVLVAAAGIMLIQSYLYSVGNIATATIWIALFVLGPVALQPRPARAARRVFAHEAVA